MNLKPMVVEEGIKIATKKYARGYCVVALINGSIVLANYSFLLLRPSVTN